MKLGLERIGDLVVKLRTFSRLDEGALKHVSVRESVDALLTILRHRFEDRIEVRTVFGEPDIVECYPSLLNQAVMNLVTNSIDAIEGTGTIEITTGGVGDEYVITVSDTGVGIPAQVRERVFEPFFTTKAVGDGTGLGLSLAYSIVEKHGGSLCLDSLEQGTRGTIRIPMRSRS
jgi:two-component system NtrC family sensor kinase